MKKTTFSSPAHLLWPLFFMGLIVLFAGYGRLILHPDLHTACPENDTWNFPIRWSVLTSLRDGHLPLWNPLSAFGIPWLATWQTEVFYPGTQFFKWFGLSFWNYSGVLHLLVFSWGIFRFLRNLKVNPFWAFFSSSIGLLNACAYNHLGSNSSMDTMAWMPWVFVAAQGLLDQKPFSGFFLSVFLVLQIFAGYPQIILYTFAGCLTYACFTRGFSSCKPFLFPLGGALLLSACQWLPSAEYFFFNCVRLPAVHDNPNFLLPWENLKTFFDASALAQDGKPDYVVNPTFFYFNFYSGLLPIAALGWGLLQWGKLKQPTKFFLGGFLFLILWALGLIWKPFDLAHLSMPGFLEPAKCWVLINVFELLALGLLLENLFPKPGRWKWPALAAASLNLLIPIWNRPVESNIVPYSSAFYGQYLREAKKICANLKGRVLVLPNENEHAALYTPMPDPEGKPLFKHFIPNSGYFAGFPTATFYGSTQPTWGAMDAGLYFQYGFPYAKGTLLDLLNVGLLYLPESRMPARFHKISTDGSWTLWKNPRAVGSHFFFNGVPQTGARKDVFTAFASGSAKPLENLFLDPLPVSQAALRLNDYLATPSLDDNSYVFEGRSNSYLVATQNAMPGWRAWINGNPSPIYLADGIFQCVPIPAESQKIVGVRFSYEPASFRLGLFLSLIGVMGLIGRFGPRQLEGI